MTDTISIKQRTGQNDRTVYGVYIKSMLTMKVSLSITEVGKNIKQNLEKAISSKTEGKCIAEGFIRPNSVKVLSYSSGNVNGDIIEFQTVFECMICHPVEGMLIECDTKTITKAGIHAEVVDRDGTVPVTVFVARDHHYNDKLFNNVKENMKVIIQVIGIRYELNDPYICVIGKLVEENKGNRPFEKSKSKKPIRIGGELEDSNIDYELDDDDNYEDNNE
jgi:DNA-directed RNA polymerase subunit E'/Rpb7